MTKRELITEIAKETSLPKIQIDKVITSLLSNIEGALKKGDKVSFIGFGTFMVAERAARTGRNPRTGKPLDIKATRIPKFRPGRTLKDAVE